MTDKDKDDAATKFDRRTWDKEHYSKLAMERQALVEAGEVVDPSDKGLFLEAPANIPRVPGSERAFLQTRVKRINLEAKLGVMQVVTDSTAPQAAGGYYCPVCECGLKDSASYLDHINGKRHQRRLGFSMRVEHSTLDQVKSRLQLHKQKRERDEEVAPSREAQFTEYEAKMRTMAEEEEAGKQAKKDRKRAKKDESAAAGTAGEGGEDDAAMMAMMGFSGFNTSKKS